MMVKDGREREGKGNAIEWDVWKHMEWVYIYSLYIQVTVHIYISGRCTSAV